MSISSPRLQSMQIGVGVIPKRCKCVLRKSCPVLRRNCATASFLSVSGIFLTAGLQPFPDVLASVSCVEVVLYEYFADWYETSFWKGYSLVSVILLLGFFL